MVMFENFWLLIMMSMSVVSMDLDPYSALEFQCAFVQSINYVSLIIPSVLMCARLTFVYIYLMEAKEAEKYGLVYVCRLFWKNRTFKKNQTIILTAVLCIFGIGNALIFYASNGGILETNWPNCTNVFQAIIILPVIQTITGCLLIIFSLQFIHYKILDKIKMSLELMGFTICIWIFNTVFTIAQSVSTNRLVDLNSWNIYSQGIIAVFFSLYFPLIVVIYHRYQQSKNDYSKIEMSNSTISSTHSEKVMELCRKFYCEENGIFLESYEKYVQNIVTVDYLITMFIEESSPFELNISSGLKMKVLKSTGQQQVEHIEKVHKEIKLLVQQNVMPYMKNEKPVV